MNSLLWLLLSFRVLRLAAPYALGLLGGLMFLRFFWAIVPTKMLLLISAAVAMGLASGLKTALGAPTTVVPAGATTDLRRPSMYICPDCKETLQTSEPDRPRAFPTLTVLGGIAGAVAGTFSGAILLVPLGLFAGAAADVRRCGSCGRPIAEGEEGYRAMTEHADGLGGQVYRPAAPQTPAATPPGFGPAQPSSGRQKQAAPPVVQHPVETAVPPRRGRPQTDFVFDEVTGGLVERQSPSGGQSLFDDPFDVPSLGEPGAASEEFPGLSLQDVFADPFFEIGPIDTDLLESSPIQEPPIEETPL